jgi:O-antigen/teichoic acid export membrane protein
MTCTVCKHKFCWVCGEDGKHLWHYIVCSFLNEILIANERNKSCQFFKYSAIQIPLLLILILTVPILFFAGSIVVASLTAVSFGIYYVSKEFLKFKPRSKNCQIAMLILSPIVGVIGSLLGLIAFVILASLGIIIYYLVLI